MKQPLVSFGLVFSLAVIGNLAADRLIHMLEPTWWGSHSWLPLAVCLTLFLGISTYLYVYAARTFFARNLSRQEARGKKCLIILVSTQSRPLITDAIDFTNNPKLKDRVEGLSVEVTITGDLQKDLAALDAFKHPSWNWKQILRAIEPHMGIVQRVYLVGSVNSDGSGSYKHLVACARFLRVYLITTEVIPIGRGIDFEDFNAVVESLREVIAAEKKRGRLKENDMAIDVTGGQKTASIAGASIVFNSDVVFQYVQSDTAQPKVYLYDLVYRIPFSQ
jgi:hypothetical protein